MDYLMNCFPALLAGTKNVSDKSFAADVCVVVVVVVVVQDGRADVVANDAGDRVTPAVVGYRDTEQVRHMLYFSSRQFSSRTARPERCFTKGDQKSRACLEPGSDSVRNRDELRSTVLLF